MICRRSLFLCCVLNFCLMPAETAKQQKHLLSQAFWINMTMCVIYISIEFVMKQYSWELDVLISSLWNEQMHAVLITVKCVSFVCVNVSVSFLIIFFCTSPLTFKKNAVLLVMKKKLINKVKGHYLMSENDPFVLIPRKCSVVTVKWGPCNRQIT